MISTSPLTRFMRNPIRASVPGSLASAGRYSFRTIEAGTFQVGLMEMESICCARSLGADVVPVTEGNTDGCDNASTQTARRGLRHWHVRTLFAWEPGDLMVGQRQHACAALARVGKARIRSR